MFDLSVPLPDTYAIVHVSKCEHDLNAMEPGECLQKEGTVRAAFMEPEFTPLLILVLKPTPTLLYSGIFRTLTHIYGFFFFYDLAVFSPGPISFSC